jgi:hypothetical protein
MEIFKEHVDAIVSSEGNKAVKALAILLWLVIIGGLVAVKQRFGWLGVLIVLFAIVAYTEWKLRTNKTIAKETIALEQALATARTGDLILFRSFHSFDLPELLIFRYIHAWFARTYFGHVGMVVRDDSYNAVYIAECTEDLQYDEYTGRMKNGPILVRADTRIRDYGGRVHLSRMNLPAICERKLWDYIERMKNHTFLENGIACVPYVRGLLEAVGVAKHSPSRYSTISHLLSNDAYRTQMNIERPVLIANQWVKEHPEH